MFLSLARRVAYATRGLLRLNCIKPRNDKWRIYACLAMTAWRLGWAWVLESLRSNL